MKIAQLGLAVTGLAAAAEATGINWCRWKPPVNDKILQKQVQLRALEGRAKKLQEFAYAHPERNRVAGGKGHQDTVNYIVKELEKTGQYDVKKEPFSVVIQTEGTYFLSINGEQWDEGEFQFSTSGDVTQPLVLVSNVGCDAADYPAAVAGKIALISRGTCEFGAKSSLAGAAGAVGAILYDNVVGGTNALTGTLGSTPRPTGPYVPTVGISNVNGTALAGRLTGGETVTANINVKTTIQNITTDNVIATTKCGDKNNVLFFGAHTDSVPAGPGINDDGSGTVALLEVAKQLSFWRTKNAVRFGFWSAEEVGLVGSTYHVTNLPAEERAKIRAYYNYDMIASPNYVNGIYDGDGSAFNLTGPAGSAELEEFLEEYFKPYGSVPTEFSGRSDYAAFIDFGIPSGGTFTGAEQLKTEAEVALFGGEAGVAYDVNYHQVGDTIDNLNKDAFIVHARSIAHAVAFFGTSFDSLPPKEAPPATKAKRDLRRQRNEDEIHKIKWAHDKREDGLGHTHAGCLGNKLINTLTE